MRKDVEFTTEDGVTLRGWHYRPDAGQGPFPTIVMAHGFSAVKEMYLDKFAEAFAAGGLAALVFDNRNFGASDGRSGRRSIPGSRCATTATRSPSPRRCRDRSGRIGVWGSSYSGGHVLVVGAIDRRVNAWWPRCR